MSITSASEDLEAYYKASHTISLVLICILNEMLLPEKNFISNCQKESSSESLLTAHKSLLNERNALNILNIQELIGQNFI